MLHGPMFQERLLQVVGTAVRGGETFYGENGRSLQFARRKCTGLLRFAINDDRTSPTGVDFTTWLGPVKPNPSRKMSSKTILGETSIVIDFPFTVNDIFIVFSGEDPKGFRKSLGSLN